MDTNEHLIHRQIAEHYCGKIDWFEESKGHLTCPGASEHTTTTGKSDAIIYLDGAPTIFCFHQSCIEARKEANRELRRAIADGVGEPKELNNKEQKRRAAEEAERERLETRAAKSLPLIIKRYAWPSMTILTDSPVILFDVDPASHGRLLIERYHPNDLIWIGERYESGSEAHRDHFQTREEWLALAQAPAGPLICPATFKTGSFSRNNAGVLYRRFLVVESDVLGRDQVGGIFRWMRDEVKLPLVAVVDTAGKSLHGWFEFPKPAVLRELQIMLPAMGCDPGMFTASQPARLPGALRDGKHQRLLYLAAAENQPRSS